MVERENERNITNEQPSLDATKMGLSCQAPGEVSTRADRATGCRAASRGHLFSALIGNHDYSPPSIPDTKLGDLILVLMRGKIETILINPSLCVCLLPKVYSFQFSIYSLDTS